MGGAISLAHVSSVVWCLTPERSARLATLDRNLLNEQSVQRFASVCARAAPTMKSSPAFAMVLLVTGAVCATPQSADACGALPTASFSFALTSPSDGATGVATDAPIYFELACSLPSEWSAEVREASCRHLPTDLQVTVSAKDASRVAGRVVRFDDRLAFVPLVPLTADTLYRVDAAFPEGGFGRATRLVHTFGFRTGSTRLSPFRASVDHADVAVDWYLAPVAACDGARLVGTEAVQALHPAGCPGPYVACRAAGSERARRLRVSLGTLVGGAAERGFAVELRVTDHTPGSFDRPGFAVPEETARSEPHAVNLYTAKIVHAHEPAEVTIDLPVLSEASTLVCIRIRASDAAGQVISDERCVSYGALVALATTPGEGSHSSATDTDAGEPARSYTDRVIGVELPEGEGGCTLSGSSSQALASRWWYVALMLGLVVRRRSARRKAAD